MGKYPREMVERYFAVDMWSTDANEENTLAVPDLVIFVKTKFYQMQPGGINGDPRTEDWKEIRPITAGLFARGAYPVEKPFFMTYRFDLKEKVDCNALKTAWKKTTKIYPYVTYATVTRRSDFVLSENPLDFVIEETGEVIEPSTPAANFHTVTLCYLGNTLWLYVDHVPYDGTGFMRVLETLFYHYYCITDGCEYQVPERVFSEKDDVLEEKGIDGITIERIE